MSEISGQLEITTALVTALIAQQFPQWAHLPITPVQLSGWDNRTFRLGHDMSIRLPSAQKYAFAVEKEQHWLPILAPHLSVAIPEPLAMGHPCEMYPFAWSVYRWIEGESANSVMIDDAHLSDIARSLAQFLKQLQVIDTTGGHTPGPHNFWRGDSLAIYDVDTRARLAQLHDCIDVDRALVVWQKSLSSHWSKNLVWIHGDLAAGNILLQNNQLVAVIDFGCMAIGDPACDLVIAWTLLKNESRKLFKAEVNLDADTWARARGWALWKATFDLYHLADKTAPAALKQMYVIHEILNDSENECG
jgi:aminoglycoside phosphotransferase (APT) family kinase protein